MEILLNFWYEFIKLDNLNKKKIFDKLKKILIILYKLMVREF